MMKHGLSRLTRRLFRRGQTGQTIVILAFGFIVLLGFVGIVTDVSLMFVRYSTLRRAIDAAAVSAAGQMRRVVPVGSETYGQAYARGITQVNLAARQFIELYGVSPTTVVVDTCATTRKPDGTYSDPQLECESTLQPRKLVRVTAQVQSPTVFLRLLGWGTVTLEATAISETAVLDVVMIFDVSESMLNQTSYDDWAAVPGNIGSMNPNQSMRYYPARMTSGAGGGDAVWNHFGGDWVGAWTWVLNHSQDDLNNTVDAGNYYFRPKPFWVTGSGPSQSTSNPTAAQLANNQPRKDCQVRFFPAAQSYLIPNGTGDYLPNNDVLPELQKYMTSTLGLSGTYPTNWDGFMPAYNYYGCCNDPSGNFQFDDLVCQPMQKVRSASKDFLDRIDFSRGDRVGFVTFDRTAYIVDPDGTCPTCTGTAMMDAQITAKTALERIVGVRSEPSFYADTNQDGYWDNFVIGGGTYSATTPDPNANVVKYDGTPISFNGTTLGTLRDYPVKDNCFFQNATLAWPFSLYSSPPFDQASPTVAGRPLYNVARDPNPLASIFTFTKPDLTTEQRTVMHPNLNDTGWFNSMSGPAGGTPAQKKGVMAFYSYELRAGCRGSNVGAALREANNLLHDEVTKRTEGSVWVMVMLGDGAAAGSDPVVRNSAPLQVPSVYNAYAQQPVRGDYGVYGVCPYDDNTHTGALVDSNWSRAFPYCSDPVPEDRHFCPFGADTSVDPPKIYTDIGKSDCQTAVYDVDDFARDWADYIGLINYNPPAVKARLLPPRDPNTQLPTIFTIGFGLDFQNGGSGACAHADPVLVNNTPDCLGEELLRYIADVGDNNRMDSDYEQDKRADYVLDGNLDTYTNEDWGPRSPCEGPILGYSDASIVPPAALTAALVNPLPPGENCGNYFNAPDAAELQNVFDTIASRMFTRLTR